MGVLLVHNFLHVQSKFTRILELTNFHPFTNCSLSTIVVDNHLLFPLSEIPSLEPLLLLVSEGEQATFPPHFRNLFQIHPVQFAFLVPLLLHLPILLYFRVLNLANILPNVVPVQILSTNGIQILSLNQIPGLNLVQNGKHKLEFFQLVPQPVILKVPLRLLLLFGSLFSHSLIRFGVFRDVRGNESLFVRR